MALSFFQVVGAGPPFRERPTRVHESGKESAVGGLVLNALGMLLRSVEFCSEVSPPREQETVYRRPHGIQGVRFFRGQDRHRVALRPQNRSRIVLPRQHVARGVLSCGDIPGYADDGAASHLTLWLRSRRAFITP